MSKLMILGAGGHGKVVAEIALLMKNWDEIVFLDDNRQLKEINGLSVIGQFKDYEIYKDRFKYAFVAIGDNKLRLSYIEKLLDAGFNVPILIHPFTAISYNIKIEEGTVIMAGTVINTNSTIGRGCIINTSSSIDHNCIIEDGVHISPGAHVGGTTHIGKNTWICISASVANNINIGNNVIVAAGAAVTKDIEDNFLVAGVPAIIKKHLKQFNSTT